MSLLIPSSYFCPPPVDTDTPFVYICPILITCIFHPLAQMTQTISSTQHTLFSANCNERCLFVHYVCYFFVFLLSRFGHILLT